MNTGEAQAITEPRARGSLLTRLRSYFFCVPVVYLYTGVFGVAALVCSLFDRDGHIQHRIAHLWARSCLRAVGIRVQVDGRERLHSEQAAVYAANHLSAIDIPALYAELPGQFRIMAKKELFRYPFLGWYLKRSGQIPIVLGDAHASLRSLNRGCDALRKGMPLVVFPEGGRSASGQLQEFMGGAFYVAIRAQVPVVPVAIVGSFELLPMNSFHALPGVVRLHFGDPIPTSGMRLRDMEKLSAQVRRAIVELHDAETQGAPAISADEPVPNPMVQT
ncbi:MAG TPA: lysophospholipid acyltransferase family protein [Bryocella sp.]|nr:lysophospholipid acyltransferase family protein [Bryocella sp.]